MPCEKSSDVLLKKRAQAAPREGWNETLGLWNVCSVCPPVDLRTILDGQHGFAIVCCFEAILHSHPSFVSGLNILLHQFASLVGCLRSGCWTSRGKFATAVPTHCRPYLSKWKPGVNNHPLHSSGDSQGGCQRHYRCFHNRIQIQCISLICQRTGKWCKGFSQTGNETLISTIFTAVHVSTHSGRQFLCGPEPEAWRLEDFSSLSPSHSLFPSRNTPWDRLPIHPRLAPSGDAFFMVCSVLKAV